MFLRNVYVEPLCGTSGIWTFKSAAFLWSLGTFIYGTWELVRMEPLWYIGEPGLLRVEPLCGTLEQAELLRAEPLCGVLGNLNF